MLSEIIFRGFRNLADGAWRPGAGGQLLVGPNGAGKTSLLEAVYLLATSKSFRASRLADCCRHGREEFTLFGRLEGEIRVEIELRWGAPGIERRANGKAAALTDYLAAMPVIAWSAGEARLIDGIPEIRRRFLDQGVVGLRPAALAVLGRYRRALEQKRRLLKSGGRGLEAWNEVLAGSAADLIAHRRAYVGELESAFSELVKEVDLELPSLELRYLPSPAGVGETAIELFEHLSGLEPREREMGQPLAGPHRDELKLYWGSHEVRRVSSAGERKLFGLLISAARGRILASHGREPLILLDDLDAELDEGRLDRLWGLFAGWPQVFASTTDEGLAERLGGLTAWRLERGVARAAKGPANTPLSD